MSVRCVRQAVARTIKLLRMAQLETKPDGDPGDLATVLDAALAELMAARKLLKPAAGVRRDPEGAIGRQPALHRSPSDHGKPP